jgi:pimeloyl-ACP methyl ester carboxylesterase
MSEAPSPRGEFRAVPAAGHLANLEAPALFNVALLGFLQKRPG